MKYAGLIIVFLSSVFIGKIVGDGYRRRAEAIGEFICFVDYIKCRIAFYRSPVDEIFASYRPGDGTSLLSKSGFNEKLASYDFNEALKMCKSSLHLKESEYNILSVFGNELGKSGSEEQIKNCDFCIEQLGNEYKKANEELPRELKLASSLSIGAGLMTVIIFI